ncbi:MAG: hypothetical protein K2M75_07975 [Clostridia bacterium]|nr:hypothetical protein [Clostridia bacterium]
MGNKGQQKDNQNTKFSEIMHLTKRIITRNVALLAVSTVISVCIEMIRQAVLYAKENPNIGIENLFNLFKEDKIIIDNAILNIILMALIIWCIMGDLTQKVEDKNKTEDQTPFWIRVPVIIFLVITLLWYAIQELMLLDKMRNVLSGLISFGFFVFLALYFADGPNKKEKYTDTCIAPEAKQIENI